MWPRFLDLAGIDTHPISHTERLVSIAGGFFGILLVYLSSYYFLGGQGTPLIVASMGASAVLLFGVPHGTLSQPWPLVGGHVLSALIGVTCAKLIPLPLIAVPLAVALAIGAMHYLRCIHPPGGATAFTAALGTASISRLGYGFVIMPVLLNVTIILIVAIGFNWFFPWRRYPAILAKRKRMASPEPAPAPGYESIAHEDFVYALSRIDSFIDVNEHDLMRIYQLATNRHSSSGPLDKQNIKLGHYYSNGEYGMGWSVRQIVDQSSQGAGQDSVIYKVVAGQGRRTSGVMSRADFSQWAKHEVIRDDENWRRVAVPSVLESE